MKDLSPWYLAREAMAGAVAADLYGSAADELLDESPLDRFIVGILHPLEGGGSTAAVEAANEVPEDESEVAPDAGYDPGVSFAHLRYPSTIGLTFGVTEETQALSIVVRADRYAPVALDGPAVEPIVASRAKTQTVLEWRRVSHGPTDTVIDLTPGTKQHDLHDGLQLRAVVRPPRWGVVSVTVVLLNTTTKPEKERSDAFAWFRPEIEVSSIGGEFADRSPERLLGHLDADERSGALLYRKERNLAVGHGVAVTWEEQHHVTHLATTFFPTHDLQLAEADRADIAGLEMPNLADAGSVDPLLHLVAKYEAWILEQRARIPDLPQVHQVAARKHLEEAERAAQRMRRGIALLEEDEVVGRAFRLMNQVMQEQRTRQEMIRQRLTRPPTDIVGAWRPFQIAFILLNLEGVASADSGDRDLADLLWFPTGGGKTEAYLGLIAITLLLRRLRGVGENGDGGGVGVIMRYTLRLLTLQQFERAAGLICALEDLRERESDLKSREPFSIGLWVGQAATPNNAKDAAAALKKKRNDEPTGELGDPVQLLRCPWCGTQLTPYDYAVVDASLQVRCSNRECRFARGLPVHLIDSDVYARLPSLVIGTVDKFAMLAWKAEAGRLFGVGFHAPPDLIVQDELHLISGPLGTLVGLYETAIDHLATDGGTGRRPKVVASTATIRRASQQVRAVFDRESRQFPPPGIDAGDSFFAVDAEAAQKGTRRYVGLMAPSTSHATLLVRTYAALLQGARDLDCDDDVRDAYWTLLGYFNSLRVLGSAYIQSIDDVRDRIKVVATRNGSIARATRSPDELTSRVRSSDIPDMLDALATPYPSKGSPDIVLATNMISVGVDVDRLGLMAVMGQPQTTAEYIQSTSRVGRKHPGLVFTMFNASRSRDLSHYEGFTSYHRALYQQVEATGATPFAARALDRGLHGLLAILARHGISGAAGDVDVRVPVAARGFAEVVAVIRKRVLSVQREDGEDVAAQVEASLQQLIDQWTEAADDNAITRYVRWPKQSHKLRSLIVPAGDSSMLDDEGELLIESFPPSSVPWPTLTSLRNVDRESTLKIMSSRRAKPEEVTDGHD
ncbi:helicase-related protein [Agrococcus citreus]|uniref:Helicase-related protein n=1 Tax=Agrococcus citreus TaxID=84643 RepID=A0ABP4JNR7_9MICO